MRLQTRVIASLACLAASGVLVPATATASSSTRLLSAGDAWGSYARSGATVVSGPTAPSVIGCGGTHSTNNVASETVPGLLSSGAVTTDTRALTVNGAPATRSTTRVANLRLLGGRITADAVKAVSTTARTRSGLRSTGAGSAFVNLRIDGRALSATPRPNQRVNLPGLGYVILNHRYVENRGARGRTQMLEAHLTDGTTVIVSHARSELRPVGGILGGVAFGSSALASSGRALAANGGPSARLFEPCGGTHGRTISNRIATLQVPNVVTLSNVVSTAKGTVSPSKASEQLTNHSEQASLLNGLVRARAVRAVANGAAVNGARAFNGRGSGFLDLSVQGHPGIGAHPAPNTRIRLAGLGMLWLHRVIRRPSSFEVRMVELDVTQRNNRGLPVGAVVKVGVAKARVK